MFFICAANRDKLVCVGLCAAAAIAVRVPQLAGPKLARGSAAPSDKGSSNCWGVPATAVGRRAPRRAVEGRAHRPALGLASPWLGSRLGRRAAASHPSPWAARDGGQGSAGACGHLPPEEQLAGAWGG